MHKQQWEKVKMILKCIRGSEWQSGCLQLSLSSTPLFAQDLSFLGKSSQQVPQVACSVLGLLISARHHGDMVCRFEPFCGGWGLSPRVSCAEERQHTKCGAVYSVLWEEKIQNESLFLQRRPESEYNPNWIQSAELYIYIHIYIYTHTEKGVCLGHFPQTLPPVYSV